MKKQLRVEQLPLVLAVTIVGEEKCFFSLLSSSGWSNNQTDRRQINRKKLTKCIMYVHIGAPYFQPLAVEAYIPS